MLDQRSTHIKRFHLLSQIPVLVQLLGALILGQKMWSRAALLIKLTLMIQVLLLNLMRQTAQSQASS